MTFRLAQSFAKNDVIRWLQLEANCLYFIYASTEKVINTLKVHAFFGIENFTRNKKPVINSDIIEFQIPV